MNSLVNEYTQNGRLFLNKVIDYYTGLPDLNKAIEKASQGQNHMKVMDEHQWHVGYTTTSYAKDELFKYAEAIEHVVSFADLFKITEIVREKVDNVGDLWSYDTALRIGFKLRIYPDFVYLQRGAREGARKLLGKKKIYGRYLGKDIFIARIPDLNKLECYEIENFLCDFKDRFNHE